MVSSNMSLTKETVIVAGAITVAVTLISTYLHQKLKKVRIPTEWKEVGRVTTLCIYPFKSGKRIEVEKAVCTKQGLMEVEKMNNVLRLRDRTFVVYQEESHEYRNARYYPKMILVEIQAYDVNTVTLKAPDMQTLFLKIPSKSDHKEVSIKHYKQEEITSIDCGNNAAAWISQYILGKDRGLRMAYHDGSYKRTQINKLYKDLNDYYQRGLRNESAGLNADLTAMHIVSSVSVRDVNKRMGNSDVTVYNFRPNLVVDGPNLEPYEEDDWQWLKVGDVVIKNVVECRRCTITTIDAETGVRRKDREPLKTMEKYRISKGPEKSPVMGILLEVFQTGVISVGTPVYISQNS